MTKTVNSAYITIELNTEGHIKIDTNMNGFGAIHMISNAIQLIIEKEAEQAERVESESEEIIN